MLVNFEGVEYQFDLEALDLSEARYIKNVTGFSVGKLLQGLAEVDPDATAAAYWLMLKQNGQTQDMRKMNFPVLKFAEVLNEAFDAEEAAKAEDPTEAEPAASQA